MRYTYWLLYHHVQYVVNVPMYCRTVTCSVEMSGSLVLSIMGNWSQVCGLREVELFTMTIKLFQVLGQCALVVSPSVSLHPPWIFF